MNINKEYLKNNFNFIICLIISIIITSTCVILLNISSNMKSTTTYSNLSNYALIANNLNSINSSLNNCTADTSLNIVAASSLLKNGLADLDNCKTSLASLSSNDNSQVSSNLLKALDDTYNLYTYCLNYISTYEDSSLDELAANLDALKNNCIASYSKLSDEGISLNYSSSLQNFLYAFISHYSKLNQSKIESELKHSQNTEFITDLNDKENSFNFLKKDLNSVSIPEGYLNYYNNLNDIFSLYSSYLNSMRTAIIYERSSSDYKKNKTVIDKNYDNAYKKYNNVLESIQQFLSLLENS